MERTGIPCALPAPDAHAHDANSQGRILLLQFSPRRRAGTDGGSPHASSTDALGTDCTHCEGFSQDFQAAAPAQKHEPHLLYMLQILIPYQLMAGAHSVGSAL